MKKIVLTEKQLIFLGENEKTLKESFISDYFSKSSDNEEPESEIEEGKRATIKARLAKGTSKKEDLKDGTFDTGDKKEKISLNNYFDLYSEDGMARLELAQPDLIGFDGELYKYLGYQRRGMKGIRLNVEYISGENQGQNRIIDGSNIYVPL